MANFKLTKKDILWSYISQFLNLGAGLITLPFVLRILTADEIGMNYLMITVSTMVALLDFGFAPQFARNITYVFAGAQALHKEGVEKGADTINYTLLKNMIGVAKMVYTRLAVLSLLIMLTAGTWYIYQVTEGFTNVPRSLLIWIIYSFSVFFNVYFFYYTSLLMGRGRVKESKIAMIAQKLSSICLTLGLLFAGVGLLGVVLSNLLSPFVGRFISHKFFYDKELKQNLENVEESREQKIELFKIIWYNAQKLGLVFLGSYAANKFGMFLAGLFLSLQEIASFGLMMQLFNILASTSSTFNSACQPQFAAYRTSGDNDGLIKRFAFTMNIFYIIFIVGALIIICLGPWILKLIGSNATLPSILTVTIYAIMMLLEKNHAQFSTIIVTGNQIPFVESTLIAGGAMCVLSFFSLKFTSLGILGVVAAVGLCNAVYANWKWPYVVCKQFHVNFFKFLKIGAQGTIAAIESFLKRSKVTK